ncbi:MAG TPA: DUF6252 family protein [Puia sp.]|nr:DUF6252 family protein [Puia sp.]
MKFNATSLLGLSVIAVSTLFFASSCSKSNSNSSSTSISASINGKVYQPSTVQAIDSVGILGILGFKNADTSALYIEFSDTVSLNKPLDITGDVAYAEYSRGFSLYSSWINSSHGTITVTSLDKANKKVAGQFNGVLYGSGTSDSVVIVNGQFNSTYLAK